MKGEIDAEAEASAENIVSALKAAFEDAGAAAIVLRINSPGGSPVQAGIVNDELKRLKAKHKKKVYAVVEEICASGAYYIAAAADEIYVDKASIVGSIGVLIDGFGFTGTIDKLGIERRLLTAGDNKAMLDPFSPLDEKHRAYAQAMIDQIHGQFIAVVKDGRGTRLKDNADTFSGLFWNGEEAVKNGLADRFGNLDYVAREVIKAEEVVDYTPKENVAERLAKRFGAVGRRGRGAGPAVAGPDAVIVHWVRAAWLALALAACATAAPDVERLRSARFILLGEVHDNAEQHRLRAALLRDLLADGRPTRGAVRADGSRARRRHRRRAARCGSSGQRRPARPRRRGAGRCTSR